MLEHYVVDGVNMQTDLNLLSHSKHTVTVLSGSSLASDTKNGSAEMTSVRCYSAWKVFF